MCHCALSQRLSKVGWQCICLSIGLCVFVESGSSVRLNHALCVAEDKMAMCLA